MRLTFLLTTIFTILFSSCNMKKTSQEAIDNNPFLADPAIFSWNGTYYLYGTGGIKTDGEYNHNDGFLVYTSDDLKSWKLADNGAGGFALKKGDAYGDKGFWAPQVFNYNDKFYMAYTANEQIAIASSDSPMGPFKQDTIKAISMTTRQIDPFVFFDDDGKIYMYHVRLVGENCLFVAELNNDLSTIDESTLTRCFGADCNSWEDTHDAEWRVAEGPTVIKDNDTYHFFYSTNDFRNIDYAVGYATSKSPIGEWQKFDKNPIIDRHMIQHNGTGHGDLFYDNSGKLYYVFHTHLNTEEVGPRRTAIIEIEKTKDGYFSKPETFRFLEMEDV